MQASNSEFDLKNLGVDLRDNTYIDCRFCKTKDQSSSGLREEIPPVDLAEKIRKKEELRKFDKGDAGIQDHPQTLMRDFYRLYIKELKDLQQIAKQQREMIENLNRQIRNFHEVRLSEGISLPDPASIPRNETCPEVIADPREQDNEPNNLEPVPGVNTSKKRRYGKGKGAEPVEFKEVTVDLLSGPSVPLCIGIPATDVVSVGRGSHAEEAFQNGRKWKNTYRCPIL